MWKKGVSLKRVGCKVRLGEVLKRSEYIEKSKIHGYESTLLLVVIFNGLEKQSKLADGLKV